MQSLEPSPNTLARPQPASSPLPKYLHQRGKNYYFKRRIPNDVTDAFPNFNGQAWKSLETSSLGTALVFLAVEVTEFDLTVANARRAKAADIAQALAAQESKPVFSIMRKAPKPAQDRASPPGGVSTQQVTQPHTVGDLGSATVTPIARSSQAEHGGVAPGVKLSTKKPIVARSRTTKADSPSSRDVGSRVTMQHLFEDWKRKQTRLRSINSVRTAVMEFRTVTGMLPVEELTKQHARQYRDELIQRRLSKLTVENRLGFLSTLMRHGMRELVEHLHFNPFEHIDVVGAIGIRQPKDRRAYRISELNQILSSRLYTEGYRPEGQAADASYWVPILGPFLGARIEEVCQLRIEDVQRVNGVWCVRICDLDEEQKLKTGSSFRRVPLHDAVIQCGFLLYVAKLARAGHVMVFPTLTNDNANKIFSNSVGKWFGRYLETIGLTDHRLDYHSYRYTFRQQCSLCGIENEVRDALTGHWVSKNDSGRTYMKGENRQYPFPKLTTAIQQLRYDELKISHIFVDDPLHGVEEALVR
jgi:integrase